MKKNIGRFDRLLRIILGAALLIIAVNTGQLWAYLGIVPLLTGIIGWCPAYQLIGLTTLCKRGTAQ